MYICSLYFSTEFIPFPTYFESKDKFNQKDEKGMEIDIGKNLNQFFAVESNVNVNV